MRNSIRVEMEIPEETMGMDLGDRWSHYCIVDRRGQVVDEGRVPTRRKSMESFFSAYSQLRVVLETGTHSRWISLEAQSQGHEVIVANPRKVRLISQNKHKRDTLDAELLARLGRVDPQLLFPIQHRGEATQADLAVLKARDELVKVRTQLINHMRGGVKAFGGRLPKCSTESFHKKVQDAIPAFLQESLEPILKMVERLTQQIRSYDQKIEHLCEQYPETKILRQVKGVGPILSLAYVLTIEDARRFTRSRHTGPYFGLTPKLDQSGDHNPELRISKQGDSFVRKLLVNGAHYILGPFGQESDLRRHGEKIASGGGKRAKKRAVVAVARKLSVLMHHLWITEEVYEPLYNQKNSQQRAA